MSADNYLYIDDENRVWHCTASCACMHKKHCLECQKGDKPEGQGKNLDEAMEIAEEIDREEGYTIEYGITRELWCK